VLTYVYGEQFIKRKGKVLTADMLASTAVGHKDVLKSLYDVWYHLITVMRFSFFLFFFVCLPLTPFRLPGRREIFQKAAPSKHKALRDLITRQSAEKSDYYGTLLATHAHDTHMNEACLLRKRGECCTDTLGYDPDAPTRHYGGGASQREQSRFDSLYETLADHGEMERIIDGCFENYLKFTMNDPCLAKARTASSAFPCVRRVFDTVCLRSSTDDRLSRLAGVHG
jgi:hypothetical protein